MNKLSVLLSTNLMILLFFSTAGALTINAIDGDSTGTTGGVDVNYIDNVPVAYGNHGEKQVKLGRSTASGQSALGFIGSSDSFTSPEILINSFTSPEGYNNFTQLWGKITTSSGVNPIPEPATMILFGAGLVGLVSLRLRKKK